MCHKVVQSGNWIRRGGVLLNINKICFLRFTEDPTGKHHLHTWVEDAISKNPLVFHDEALNSEASDLFFAILKVLNLNDDSKHSRH